MLWEKFFLAPDLATALQLKAEYGPAARFISGGTDLIVELESGRRAPSILIDVSRIIELAAIEVAEQGLRIGAGCTYAALLSKVAVQERASILMQAAIEVGSPQIRNRGTLAGNLVTASPAADIVPPLIALDASVELESVRGRRELPISQFITGFRKVDLADDEIVRSILIPNPKAEQHGVFLKLGLRKAQAISVVSVSAVLEFGPGGFITKASLVFGSVAATPLIAFAAQELLVGQAELSVDLIKQVAQVAQEETSPISDVRGSSGYRKEMVKVFTTRALRMLQIRQIPIPSVNPNIFLQMPGMKASPQVEVLQADQPLEFELNGQLTRIEGVADTVLLYALRQAGFTGTKEGCFEGECGACTVLLDGKAVNSCLVPANTVQGCRVQTVEGLAQADTLHPLQQSFIEQGGVQCGFCTPGFLIAGSVLLAERPAGASETECRAALVGNLCRCTGYGKILAALQAAQEIPR